MISFEVQSESRSTLKHEGSLSIYKRRSRLVDFLSQRQYIVLPVNPNATAKYRESRFPSGAKSDPGDAHLIADYIREHEKVLKPISIPEEKIRELRLLLEDRDRLIGQKVRFSN